MKVLESELSIWRSKTEGWKKRSRSWFQISSEREMKKVVSEGKKEGILFFFRKILKMFVVSKEDK